MDIKDVVVGELYIIGESRYWTWSKNYQSTLHVTEVNIKDQTVEGKLNSRPGYYCQFIPSLGANKGDLIRVNIDLMQKSCKEVRLAKKAADDETARLVQERQNLVEAAEGWATQNLPQGLSVRVDDGRDYYDNTVKAVIHITLTEKDLAGLVNNEDIEDDVLEDLLK